MLVAKRLLSFLCIVAFAFACLTLIQPNDHVHAKEKEGCLVSVTCSTCPSPPSVECRGHTCVTLVSAEAVRCDKEYTYCSFDC